jgi:hypothetical protein
MGVDCISGQKAPLRRILRNFRLRMRTPLRSLRVTFHNVTSGQNAPLGRILRNLWLPMRTPKETPKESRDLWSLPVAMVLVLLYILYYFYSEGKARELVAHTQKIFLVAWVPVTSGSSIASLHHKYCFVRTHILLIFNVSCLTSSNLTTVSLFTVSSEECLTCQKVLFRSIWCFIHTFMMH